MKILRMEGGHRISGTLPVQGAKNSCLPLLAASLLGDGRSVFTNCPVLSDVDTACRILEALGCTVCREGQTITVEWNRAGGCAIPDQLMHQMRSSIVFLGAVLSRCKRAVLTSPGGCELGPRPIDLHLDALRRLGADIREEHGYLICEAKELHGAKISLLFPSVGATENILLAAAMAKGRTVIYNAAQEPEICDLARYLNARGARISGAGKSTIRIDGVDHLHGVTYPVMPDRIWTATMLGAAAITGGEITLTGAAPNDLESVLPVLEQMGCDIVTDEHTIHLEAPKRLRAVKRICTMPYPGFPTDAQAPVMALLSTACGTSLIVENIFENRFKQAIELCRMGADIKAEGRIAVVTGVPRLLGATVHAEDLRGGAALVLAGLSAKGETVVRQIEHIDRGYQRMEEDLRRLGAVIEREEEE